MASAGRSLDDKQGIRLSETERTALLHALRDVQGEIFIYGSRTDPAARGGDIDVLVINRADSPYRLSQDITVKFQMECDEKIDVLVMNPDAMPEEQAAFVTMILKTGVRFR